MGIGGRFFVVVRIDLVGQRTALTLMKENTNISDPMCTCLSDKDGR